MRFEWIGEVRIACEKEKIGTVLVMWIGTKRREAGTEDEG